MRIKEIASLIAEYHSGFSLAQPFYTDPEVLAAEWTHIWGIHWLFAGTVAQIPRPGDYFLYHLQQESVIIIRGNNGEVYAHYNTCTHRGSALCMEEKGHAAKLVCPYHQWVFDKDGTLLQARLMPEDFCKQDYPLRSLPLQEVEGLLFISLSPSPPDFTPIRNALGPYLRPFQLPQAKLACSRQYLLRANWKLVAENFRECYHCGGAHPEYCSAVIGANLREDTTELTREKELLWRSKGLETTLTEVTDGTTSYAVRYPLRPGIESYSTDGKKVSLPMGLHTDHDAGVVGLVNYPNFWMDAVSDYVWTMRITPVDAAHTSVEFCWYVDPRAQEGKDYVLDHLTAFWERTGEQDALLCENNFRGIETAGYRPGPYAPVEDQVVNFVEWCVKQLREGLNE
jgi:phenylpropionate dioxygenase-like ring-hydroxylating dioxygenase large terminal subunit